MAQQVNYEVQVMQGGRWTIHARFPATGMDEAIEEGKEAAVSRIGDVRVLRDVYDTDTGMSNEFTVYSSKMKDKANSDGGDGGDGDWGGGGGGSIRAFRNNDGDDDEDDWGDEDSYSFDEDGHNGARRLQKEKKRRARAANAVTLTNLIVKLLLIILSSMAVAAASAAFAFEFLDGINLFGIRMVGSVKEYALIILFLGVFVVIALVLSFILFANTSLKTRSRKPIAATRHVPQNTAKTAAAPVDPTVDPAPTDAPDYAEELRKSLEDDADDLAKQTDSDDSANDINAALEQGIKEATFDDLSSHEEKQKAYMKKFMGSALEATGQDKKAMSNFDKFGASLFLAGACETMTQESGIADDIKERIMADSMQTMGFKEDHARSFARKYEEYLVQDSSYMQMFQAGRNSMNTYFTDESHIEKNMTGAMNEWNKPKTKEEQVGPITVLFTDIAGSTAMTQELGDTGAQHVIRTHNRIVREALTGCNGKEVKHTGDGIMASFAKTSDSLDAAIQMQREASAYTAENQDKPLFLKIGINSGEPIAEDNDLFGSTVQMSARIVDKAQKEEIFISEIVHGLCAGKDYKFKNRGSYPMKGFETDLTLYEVLWRE